MTSEPQWVTVWRHDRNVSVYELWRMLRVTSWQEFGALHWDEIEEAMDAIETKQLLADKPFRSGLRAYYVKADAISIPR